MKRLIVLIVIILVIAGGWLLLSNKNNPDNTSKPTAVSTHSQTAQPTQAKSPTATDKVTMLNVTFTPSDITIKKGTTVTWTNQDAVEHTVTESDGKTGPSGPPLSQGQSYTFTFNEAGTFHYHCTIHSEMSGTVIVTES